jgi:hypothetical protein
LSAFSVDDALILGHLEVDEKSNEIPAAQGFIARQSGWERRVNQDENWRPRIMIVVGGPFDKCVCAANV